MSTTPRRLITRVMRGLNFTGRNSDPTPTEMTDAFETLNDMISGWNRENMLRPYKQILDVTLTATQALYTIGQSGTPDITNVRPDKIEEASMLLGTSPAYVEVPLNCLKTSHEWQQVVFKSTTTSMVTALFYNPKYPNGEINIYPVPSTNLPIRLYLQNRLSQFATIDDTLDMEDGFTRALRYNLGVELAPELNVPLPENWGALAITSLGKIKSSNIEHGLLDLETPGIGGAYLLNSDSYVRQ